MAGQEASVKDSLIGMGFTGSFPRTDGEGQEGIYPLVIHGRAPGMRTWAEHGEKTCTIQALTCAWRGARYCSQGAEAVGKPADICLTHT